MNKLKTTVIKDFSKIYNKEAWYDYVRILAIYKVDFSISYHDSNLYLVEITNSDTFENFLFLIFNELKETIFKGRIISEKIEDVVSPK